MWKRTWLASKGALSSMGKTTAGVFKNSSSRSALSALENPPKAETSVMRWIPYHPIRTNHQESDLNTNLDAIALFKKCPNRWVHQIVVLKDSVMTMAPINRWTNLLHYTDGIDLGSASNHLPHHLLADWLDEHCEVDSKHDWNQTSTGPLRDLWVGDQLDLSECDTGFWSLHSVLSLPLVDPSSTQIRSCKRSSVTNIPQTMVGSYIVYDTRCRIGSSQSTKIL